MYSLFNTIGVLATAFLMLFYPVISRKIQRKRLMKIMMIISTAGYGAMLLCGLLMPSTMIKFWLITLSYMAANFGIYSFYLVMMISIINTVEYNEYKHGVRDEAIIASLRPFLTKLASALVAALTSLAYILFGVTGTTNQISSFENAAASGAITEAEKLAGISSVIDAVAPSQSIGLFLCITVLPFVMMLIAYVLYQKHYKLDEPEYDRICMELAKRKELGA